MRLEEKEKIEKELLNQIIDEADDYKINFHSKRKITCDNNIATNRESEKVSMNLSLHTFYHKFSKIGGNLKLDIQMW